MKINWTLVAVATVCGVTASCFEISNMIYELSLESLSTGWKHWVWTALAILAMTVAFYELRKRMHALREPKVLRPILTFGFHGSAAIALGSDVVGLWNMSGYGLLVSFCMIIPTAIFGCLRGALEDPPDLFESTDRRLRWKTHVAEQQRVAIQHAKFLRDNPEIAAIERLPLCVRVRCGI
jgi:hypothetical protein